MDTEPVVVLPRAHSEFLVQGLDSLGYQPGGGRKAKLTPTQKKRLCSLIDAGPEAAGFDTACWNSIVIRVLIEREFGVLYDRYYVCELLRNLGYSFQKARFVSDHLDEAQRQAWITQAWPQILKAARTRKALILFGDEASFPQWGSLSYTWAKRGEQPTVKTSGKRKGYKVFGLIEYFSGRFFYQASDGKFTSESYQAFLAAVLRQTRNHLFLIQDGAKYSGPVNSDSKKGVAKVHFHHGPQTLHARPEDRHRAGTLEGRRHPVPGRRPAWGPPEPAA